MMHPLANGVGRVEGEVGESIRSEGSQYDLCFQVPHAFRWREVDRLWFDLRYCGKR